MYCGRQGGDQPLRKQKTEAAKTYPVDERADVLVDLHVRAPLELVVGREPRREGRVGEDVLALRQRLPQRRREVRHPLLGLAVALVDRGEVLVVDVDAVQAVGLDPLGHAVRDADGVRARGRRGVGRAERGRDDADPRFGVLGLLCGLCVCGEGSPVACLVYCAVEGEERQRCDVEALCACTMVSNDELGFSQFA